MHSLQKSNVPVQHDYENELRRLFNLFFNKSGGYTYIILQVLYLPIEDNGASNYFFRVRLNCLQVRKDHSTF